ncbi:MAG: tagatose 1,6-diphosphate aldolase [Rhodospirillales bacterium]|nr:tagatose 1,6-diphosphate aldolase [Rhodospirillales bacterium]
MHLSAGKLWSLRRLADTNGRFKMVAVDQRPPIMDLIKQRKKVADASYEDVAAVKEILTRNLAADCSAILLDPIWAYSRSIAHVRPGQGLLLTLEDHAFAETPGGRISREIADWSVEKIKRIGADGVKLLAWYRPDADRDVCRRQQDLVERVGKACVEQDICFLLELLVYPLPGEHGQTKDYIEHSAKRPELVVESLRTFTDPRFGVDIFKLESPIAAPHVPDPNSAEARACQQWFDALGRATTRPWVMLSAGADMKAFRHILTYAYRAGANGYLAGRAIWWAAAQMYPDLGSMDQALKADAISYMCDINRLTDDLATPWRNHPAFVAETSLYGAGPHFPKNYGVALQP